MSPHNEGSGNHDGCRNGRVGSHVQICAADVQVSSAAACEHHRRRAIDEDANRGDRNDGRPIDRLRLQETPNGLEHDCADCNQQDHGVRKRDRA